MDIPHCLNMVGMREFFWLGVGMIWGVAVGFGGLDVDKGC